MAPILRIPRIVLVNPVLSNDLTFKPCTYSSPSPQIGYIYRDLALPKGMDRAKWEVSPVNATEEQLKKIPEVYIFGSNVIH